MKLAPQKLYDKTTYRVDRARICLMRVMGRLDSVFINKFVQLHSLPVTCWSWRSPLEGIFQSRRLLLILLAADCVYYYYHYCNLCVCGLNVFRLAAKRLLSPQHIESRGIKWNKHNRSETRYSIIFTTSRPAVFSSVAGRPARLATIAASEQSDTHRPRKPNTARNI